MAKERIDVLLVEKGLIATREKAKRTIMAGLVFVEGQRVDKPGTPIDVEASIEIKGDAIPYVSRGGLKLEKAIETYQIDLAGKRCMDIGASTGGFTDCMLQNGATHVIAVDVGYGQLDWKLRNDERVTNLERTNVRYVTLETVGEPLDFISIDVSFISLKLVLPVAQVLLKNQGEIVFLIKPQFEAGREQVKKNGVVRDAKVHLEVLNRVVEIAQSLNFEIQDITFSPIKGPKGNIEFLAFARKCEAFSKPLTIDLKKLVERAHSELISEA